MFSKSSIKHSFKPNLDVRLLPDFMVILDELTEEFLSGGRSETAGNITLTANGNTSLKPHTPEAEGKIRGTLILTF